MLNESNMRRKNTVFVFKMRDTSLEHQCRENRTKTIMLPRQELISIGGGGAAWLRRPRVAWAVSLVCLGTCLIIAYKLEIKIYIEFVESTSTRVNYKK
jgi:hypothetical protein